MNNIQIRIKGNNIKFIYDDKLIDLMNQGDYEIKRASHVEPEDKSWFVDLSPSNGPKLGPFYTREEALQEEVKWILENKIPIPQIVAHHSGTFDKETLDFLEKF